MIAERPVSSKFGSFKALRGDILRPWFIPLTFLPERPAGKTGLTGIARPRCIIIMRTESRFKAAGSASIYRSR